MGRWLLYGLPLLTLLVGSLAFLGPAAQQPVRAARLYGGPTEGQQRLAWRLQLIEHYVDAETPIADVPVRVVVAGAEPWSGRSSVRGSTELVARLPRPASGPVSVRVLAADEVVAEGTVELDAERWRSGAERRGGWLDGLEQGDWRVRVAGRDGVFAASFTHDVLVSVSERGRPVAGAEVVVKADGAAARRDEKRAQPRVVTDAAGRAQFRLLVIDHVVALDVRAMRQRTGDDAGAESSKDRTAAGGTPGADAGASRDASVPKAGAGLDAPLPTRVGGRWYGSLPVVPGAMRVHRRADQLQVHCPIDRDVAWISIVTADARIGGGAVELTADGRGGAEGTLALPALPDAPLWAVVSSESDLQSPGTVGWPLDPPVQGDLRATFLARDSLLLDGLPGALEREHARMRRARLLFAGFAASALGIVALLLGWQIRSTHRELERRVAAASAEHDGVEPDTGDGEPQGASPTPPVVRALVALLVVGATCCLIGLGWMSV